MSKLITNVFLIDLPFETYQVSRFSNARSDTLSNARSLYNKTHSFFPNGNYIYCSPMLHCDIPIEMDTVTLSVVDNIEVTRQLIEHIFFRTFIENFPQRPIKFYPFTILSTKDQHDLARSQLPSNLHNRISFTRQISIHLRTLETEEGLRFAMVPDITHRWRTNISIKEMHQEGYKIVGLPTIHSQETPGYEGVFAPDERLIGEIVSHSDDEAVVQTNSGRASYPLEQLFIRMQSANIRQYLEFKVGEKANNIVRKIIRDKRLKFTPPYLIEETQSLMRYLSNMNFSNLDSFTFSLNSKPYTTSSTFPLEETILCFDPTPGSADKSPIRGLSTCGPYDSQYFTPKEPSILVICHKSLRGRVAEFLGCLEKGISGSQYFPTGVCTLLRLHKIHFQIFETDGWSPESFEATIDMALKAIESPDYSAAIVISRESWKEYAPQVNPYLRVKAKLMTAGIPVQSIKEKNILQTSKQWQYLLAPFSVQLYAKIGGTPWVLPSKTSVDVELVIGIGSTLVRKNFWSNAEQSRLIGLTTFFTGNGQFLLAQRMAPIPFEDYFDSLVDSLSNSLKQLSEEYHWKKGCTIRLVFHAHKPFKNIEADAVVKVAEQFPDYHVNFAFLKLSVNHPLLLLRHEDREEGFRNDFAQRADNLKINSKTVLLQVKSPGRGIFSNALQVTLHEYSTFQDFHYLCQQVMDFSQLNWRSIQPANKPITVFYSELLASLFNKLKRTDHWDPISLNNPKLRHSLWFL